MQVTLLYFDGCPHWRTAETRVREALTRLGRSDVVVTPREVVPDDPAAFPGSPTILVDGRDLFPDTGAPAGRACRVYATQQGLAGAPTVEQLLRVLR